MATRKPLIGYMAVMNEAEYVEYAIRSTINHLDKMIVIEGAWGCFTRVTGKIRSDDGTIDILRRLEKEFPNLEVHCLNAPTQLEQRNLIFDYIKEDCWMLLQDADEVWDEANLLKIIDIVANYPDNVDGVQFNSLTFINDFYTYTDISFPRLFNIRMSDQKRFSSPNVIQIGPDPGRPLNGSMRNDVYFFHYSYCHSPQRFMDKKRERTALNGNFKWELRNGMVTFAGFKPKTFEGQQPEIMKTHPRYGVHITQQHKAVLDEVPIYVIMQHSGIGNLIHTTPCLKALREFRPDAQIYLLTWNRSARILEGLEYIDMVVPQNNYEFLKSLNRKVDFMCLSPVGTLFHPDMERLCNRIIRHPIKPPWHKHEVEVHMDFARQIGYKGDTPHAAVKIFDINKVQIDRYMQSVGLEAKKFICINSSYLKHDQWPLKHWGQNNYTSLVEGLDLLGCRIVFIGTEEDYSECQQICEKFPNTTVNACGAFPDIKTAAELINRSSLVVGNDGGLMHVAAALDIPTVTIFTFTNPIKNMPLSPKATLCMTPCERRMACQHGGWEQCASRGCMNVPVIDVINKIEQVLNDGT